MKNSKKTALAGMLAAFAVAAGALESFVPPLPFAPPGFRIGFSNAASMTAAAVSPFAAFAVASVKSAFVLITRGATAALLSFAGGLASCAVTLLMFRFARAKVGCIGIGIASAAAHNLAQVSVYSLIIGAAAFWYLPYLLVLGTFCGALTGILLDLALKLIYNRKDAPDGAKHKK